jgi:replication-associated recombination protein RarA
MPEFEQHEDIWSRAVTVNGYRVEEVRSVLQKSIRHGQLEEAVLAAYELFASGPATEDLLWRRLEIIAVQDIGLGHVEAPAILEALNLQRLRQTTDFERFACAAHAVRLLASAEKDQASNELARWAPTVTKRGDRRVVVEESHLDRYTRRGTQRAADGSQRPDAMDTLLEDLATR